MIQRFKISAECFRSILTKGTKIIDANGVEHECIEGLPSEARYLRVGSLPTDQHGIFFLDFEVEGEQADGEEIPTVAVFRAHHPETSRA